MLHPFSGPLERTSLALAPEQIAKILEPYNGLYSAIGTKTSPD
jgi:hypothetical protein